MKKANGMYLNIAYKLWFHYNRGIQRRFDTITLNYYLNLILNIKGS